MVSQLLPTGSIILQQVSISLQQCDMQIHLGINLTWLCLANEFLDQTYIQYACTQSFRNLIMIIRRVVPVTVYTPLQGTSAQHTRLGAYAEMMTSNMI